MKPPIHLLILELAYQAVLEKKAKAAARRRIRSILWKSYGLSMMLFYWAFALAERSINIYEWGKLERLAMAMMTVITGTIVVIIAYSQPKR